MSPKRAFRVKSLRLRSCMTPFEKTDTEQHELEEQFGPRVRALVEALTDLPRESEAATHARLKSAPT